VAGRIESLDPLAPLDRAERLASRQVYEPLWSRQSGPFGATRRRPGIVRSFHSDRERSVWTATLRRGVSFQDGEPIDADAVLANAGRWVGSAAGRALLPALTAVDSPRPGRVRFILDRPAPRFPVALASPRLGLVAPGSLVGIGRSGLPLDASGSGPFEYRGREGGTVVLARNSDWWGAALGLGPGIDELELSPEPVAGHRLAALLDGSVEIADDLGRHAIERIAGAPLLTVVRGSRTIGLERSVRGIDSVAAAQSLADVWLTDLR